MKRALRICELPKMCKDHLTKGSQVAKSSWVLKVGALWFFRLCPVSPQQCHSSLAQLLICRMGSA